MVRTVLMLLTELVVSVEFLGRGRTGRDQTGRGQTRRRAGRGALVQPVTPRPKVKLIEAMMQAARERASGDDTPVSLRKLIYDTQKG